MADMPDATILSMAQASVEVKARDLARKLGETMTWADRDKGFDEWDNLVDALKALTRAKEKMRV